MKKVRLKRKFTVFLTAFILTLLFCGLFYGMAVVYVNSRNTLQAEKIQILHLTQTGWETGELSVVGQKYKFSIPKSSGMPAWAYTLIPPEIPLLYSAAEAIADEARFLE